MGIWLCVSSPAPSSIHSSSSSLLPTATRPLLLSLWRLTAHCQMWAVPSPLQVSTSSLVGWNLTLLTEPEWPWYCSRHAPLCIPHTRAVWSALAVASTGSPSLLTHT